MDNINNDYTKEMDEVNLKITKVNEEKDENAAMVIQHFYYTYFSVFTKYERPNQEVINRFRKLEERRYTPSFKAFKEDIRINIFNNNVIKKNSSGNRSKSSPLIQIPNTGIIRVRHAMSNEIQAKSPLGSSRRADFISSFSGNTNNKGKSLVGALKYALKKRGKLETIDDEEENPKRRTNAFMSYDGKNDNKHILQIISGSLCCCKRKKYGEDVSK